MSIQPVTAAELDALGLDIFNPNTDPVLGTIAGKATGLVGQDDATDARLLALITEVMQTIDGRTPASGFKYTLNVTNALQLRPKHWFMRGLFEYPITPDSLWPANTELGYVRQGQDGQGLGVYNGVNSFGWTIALSTCAAICHAWAMIVRMWLFNNYPEAVNKFTGPMPTDVIGTAAEFGSWDKTSVTGVR